MKIPIVQISDNKFQIAVEKALYSTEAIMAACYKFTDKFYVFQQTSPNDDSIVDIILESKDANSVTENITKQFCNELIDQQVRYNTTQQFGHIRDLIVEEAFKPVNK